MFVTLFNLQGTHRTLAALIKDTTSFFLCQELFRAFSNSFAALSFAGFTFAVPAALSDSLLRIAHSLPLVKNFFRNFSSPCPRRSRVRACILLCLRRSFDPSPKRLIILPERGTFVNTFLHFFCFSRSVPRIPSVRRSAPANPAGKHHAPGGRKASGSVSLSKKWLRRFFDKLRTF